MFSILTQAFFSWYRSKKNLMILIFALSMIAYVINGALGLYNQIDELAKRNLVIRLGDVAVFPESPSSTDTVYQIAGIVSYVLTWIATVMLLRPYIEKIGKVKFWIMMGAPMVYYLIEFPLFSLGIFTPSEDSNAMTNILIFSLSAIIAGILFGVAFLSIARTLKSGTAARNYMIIAAYGFVLFYIFSCKSFNSIHAGLHARIILQLFLHCFIRCTAFQGRLSHCAACAYAPRRFDW